MSTPENFQTEQQPKLSYHEQVQFDLNGLNSPYAEQISGLNPEKSESLAQNAIGFCEDALETASKGVKLAFNKIQSLIKNPIVQVTTGIALSTAMSLGAMDVAHAKAPANPQISQPTNTETLVTLKTTETKEVKVDQEIKDILKNESDPLIISNKIEAYLIKKYPQLNTKHPEIKIHSLMNNVNNELADYTETNIVTRSGKIEVAKRVQAVIGELDEIAQNDQAKATKESGDNAKNFVLIGAGVLLFIGGIALDKHRVKNADWTNAQTGFKENPSGLRVEVGRRFDITFSTSDVPAITSKDDKKQNKKSQNKSEPKPDIKIESHTFRIVNPNTEQTEVAGVGAKIEIYNYQTDTWEYAKNFPFTVSQDGNRLFPNPEYIVDKKQAQANTENTPPNPNKRIFYGELHMTKGPRAIKYPDLTKGIGEDQAIAIEGVFDKLLEIASTEGESITDLVSQVYKLTAQKQYLKLFGDQARFPHSEVFIRLIKKLQQQGYDIKIDGAIVAEVKFNKATDKSEDLYKVTFKKKSGHTAEDYELSEILSRDKEKRTLKIKVLKGATPELVETQPPQQPASPDAQPDQTIDDLLNLETESPESSIKLNKQLLKSTVEAIGSNTKKIKKEYSDWGTPISNSIALVIFMKRLNGNTNDIDLTPEQVLISKQIYDRQLVKFPKTPDIGMLITLDESKLVDIEAIAKTNNEFPDFVVQFNTVFNEIQAEIARPNPQPQ